MIVTPNEPILLAHKKNNVISDNYHFKIVDASFPQIGRKIALFYGHPDFVRLLKELKINTRSTPRAGFPPDVLFALHALEEAHDSVYPHLQRHSPHPWS